MFAQSRSGRNLSIAALIILLCSPSFAAISGGGMGGGGMGGGGMGGGGGGMGGGGSTIIDPPIGGAFTDPPQAVKTVLPDGKIEFNLEAKITPVNVNGTMANLMTFNGSYPGPTIRVKQGDIVKINYTNSLPETMATNFLGYMKNITNLHTHGWHVSPKAPSDFVMYHLMPGETYHHEYDTSLQEPGTFNFYHPHIHGLSAEQYWAGLVGALIVEDETDALANYETHIMILKDISLSGSQPAPHSTMMDYMHGKEGNIIMVNGKVNPRLTMKAGQVQRWRILNASNARFYKLALDGHTMHLIGTDGGLLDKPYQRTELLLSPGERVDVLVKGVKSSGNYKFKALPYSRMGMMGGQTITLMTVTYKGKLTQTIPAAINPNAMRVNSGEMMVAAQRTFVLSMGQGNGYINGQDFDVNPYMFHSMLGTYEIWTIQNMSGMDHPFHQHVNPAQILSVSGGDSGYASLYTSIPGWKDTVLIPKMGSVTMLVPVMDYDGEAMFHCHILEHEDIGMMGMWHIMNDMDEMPDMNDMSDMGDMGMCCMQGGGGMGPGGGGTTPLTETQKQDLIYLREEEKLARDVYQAMYDLYGADIFSHIAMQEQCHTSRVKGLLDSYGVPDPVINDARGAFTNPVFTSFYNSLTQQGAVSLKEALQVGVIVEEMDIEDIEVNMLPDVTQTDVRQVLSRLLDGSYRHLYAFNNQLAGQ